MVPKVIYMCHKKKNDIRIYSRNWRILNPDYEIKLYDDEMCYDFLLTEYSKLHADIFNFIPDGPIKADFWRVCIINKYGGLYVDADIQPLVPLSDYINKDDEFVTCISMNFNKYSQTTQLNPHFILSKSNNIFLGACIEQYIKLYKGGVRYSYWGWSICRLLIVHGITKKESQVLDLSNIKCKFLLETGPNTCKYKDIIVLRNRYDTYVNHNFI